MSVDYAKAGARQRATSHELTVGGGRVYEIATAIYGRTLALAMIVALAPLWLVIAAAIRLTSPGSVFFRAPMAGRNGRVFQYYKFRTMHIGGDNGDHLRWIDAFVRSDQPYSRDAAGLPVYKMVDDPRVTRVGRLLRRTSLDETPQLLNVLRGEMRLVGPRPPVLYEYGLYDRLERMRLAAPPGITGLYQVRRRGRASFSEMLQLDLEYVRQRSLWLDLRIILHTPRAILHGEVIAQ